MSHLKEIDVIRIMREEWNKKVSALSETIDITMKSNIPEEGETPVLSSELKVMHKKSGIRYTIDSVGTKDVILRTPEDEKILINKDELESEYELD